MNDKELAEFCALSYSDSTFTVGELEVLCKLERGVHYVAIRGTEASRLISGDGWIDVLRDMRIIPWYDKHLGWCHSGFLKGALSIMEELGLSKGQQIVVTGHSLGAGVGQLLALKMAMLGHSVKFVGFGMPRCFVGRPHKEIVDLSEWLDFKHYRHRGDIVSNIPHRWFLKYRHAIGWKQLGCKSHVDRWEDHNIQHYVRAL